jgi:hypothetical protein
MSPLSDIEEIRRRAIVHGYTGVTVGHRIDVEGDLFYFTFDQTDNKDTVKSSLVAATIPTLSLDNDDLEVTGDGESDGVVTISDSRGAAAEGKLVHILLPPYLIQLSPSTTLTLDASGEATITFGPSPSAGTVSGKMSVGFKYATDEALPIIGNFSYV